MTAYAYADRRRFQQNRRRAAFIFVSPLIVLWGLFLILPILEAAWYSLTDWDGLEASWNGGRNYLSLLHSADFGSVISNNLLLLLSVPVAVAIPFCVALLIAAEPPGWRWARALVFLPATLSWVVTGIVWLRFYAGNGILNALLRTAGLGALQMDLLGDIHTAIIPVALTFIWSQVGPNTLIFLIGFGNIDPQILEAATLDGAGLWRAVWHIVLPLMTRVIVFVTIITLVAAFTALFSLIFVMTGGGPGFSTTTMEFYIYRLAFSETEFGMGAAVGIVLLFVIACASLPLMALYRRTATS
jgi:multiple sugar transport system permease protein